MSLSPLYPHQTIDLHVRIAANLHQSFLWLHTVQAKITIFRVPSRMLWLESILRKTGRWCSPIREPDLPPLTFVSHVGFITQILAYMLDSLVRVSRRGEWNHFVNIPNMQVEYYSHRKHWRHTTWIDVPTMFSMVIAFPRRGACFVPQSNRMYTIGGYNSLIPQVISCPPSSYLFPLRQTDVDQ
jgi:hypothetical protein